MNVRFVWLETKRVLGRRWVLLCVLAFLVLAVWVTEVTDEKEWQRPGYSIELYQQITEQYAGLPLTQAAGELRVNLESSEQADTIMWMYQMGLLQPEEAREQLSLAGYKETDPDRISVVTVMAEWRIQQRVLEEMELLLQYDDYLSGIQQGSGGLSNLSFFREDLYVTRSREKAMRDYADVSVHLENWVPNFAARAFLQNRVIDGFIFAGLIPVLLLLFTEERERQYTDLTGTTAKGRRSFYFHKALALTCCTAVIVTFYEIGLLLYEQWRFGGVNWGAPVQSISAFETCSRNLSVGAAIVWTVLFKILLFTILLLFLAAIACQCTKMVQVLGILTGGTLLLAAAKQAESLNSSLGFLSCFNPFNFLDSARLVTGYRQFPIFQYPISAVQITCLWMIVLSGTGILAGALLYGRVRRERGRRKKLIGRMSIRQSGRKRPFRSFIHMEFRKLLISYKLLLPVLVLMAGILFGYLKLASLSDPQQEIFYRDYMQELNGPLTPEKEQMILDERLYFTQLEELRDQLLMQGNQDLLLNYINGLLQKKAAFEQVERQYTRIIDGEQEVFLYETGYLYLTGYSTYSDARLGGMIGVLLLSLLIPFCAWIEFGRGAVTLMRTTVYGREKLLKKQYTAYLLLAVALMACIYIGETIAVVQRFGAYGLLQDIRNIEMLYPLRGCIAIWLFLLQLTRLFGAALIVLLFMAVTCLSRDYLKAVLICLVAAGLPYLLFMNGITFMNGYFLNALIRSEEMLMMFRQGEVGKLLTILAQGVICLTGCVAVLKREVKRP